MLCVMSRVVMSFLNGSLMHHDGCDFVSHDLVTDRRCFPSGWSHTWVIFLWQWWHISWSVCHGCQVITVTCQDDTGSVPCNIAYWYFSYITLLCTVDMSLTQMSWPWLIQLTDTNTIVSGDCAIFSFMWIISCFEDCNWVFLTVLNTTS